MQRIVTLLHKSIVHLYRKYDMWVCSFNVMSGMLEVSRNGRYFS